VTYPAIPLLGQTFNTLRVVGREFGNSGHGVRWVCRCLACGAPKTAKGEVLRAGLRRCLACTPPPGQDWSSEWPRYLWFEDSVEALGDHGSPKPRPQGRPPKGSRVLVMLGGAPRWIATLGENELREVARLSKAQACKVSRERKRRKDAEAARRPPGRPCQDPEREAERVAAWQAAGRPLRTAPPAPPRQAVWRPAVWPAIDHYPFLPLPQRLALVRQHAMERRAAA